jgi:hypothetical protein
LPAAPLPAALVRQETDACFIVRVADGHALAYVYFEVEPGTAHLLTRDEATPGSRENRFTRGPPAVDESLTGVTL